MPTANIPPGTDGRPDRLSRARVSSRSTSLAKEKFRCLADPFERLTACVFRAHVGMVLLGEPEVGRSHRRVVCTTREAKRSQRRLAHEHRSDPALLSAHFQRTSSGRGAAEKAGRVLLFLAWANGTSINTPSAWKRRLSQEATGVRARSERRS